MSTLSYDVSVAPRPKRRTAATPIFATAGASAIIYLRLSDFRDEDDSTFTEREAELRAFAGLLGLNVVRVAVENDVNGNGKSRPASAYKAPKQVRTPAGLIEFRTNRPVYEGVVRDLISGAARVLIVGDDSRIARNHRDGDDLLDACRVTGASVVAPDDNGNPKWLLTNGGTPEEVSRFRDRVDDARKYSDDVAAKVRKGRRRWAGKSYQGGLRPFGFRVAPDTTEHHRTLVVDEAEAAVIKDAATAILRGVSLKAVTRDLREAGTPTVTGVAWTPSTLRDVLAKPAVAGLAVHTATVKDEETGGMRKVATLYDAPWPAILDRDTWERLRDVLAQRGVMGQHTSNEPRHLLSGVARCHCGGQVKVNGGKRSSAYVCADHAHLRRNARSVDELVTARVLALLERDGPELLKPAPAVTADTTALRAEVRKLTGKRDDLARLLAEDILTEAGVRAERKRLDARLARISAQLTASAPADPLPEFRDPDADLLAVWDGLGIARQRAIVRLVYDVVILPAARPYHVFNPDSVSITRR